MTDDAIFRSNESENFQNVTQNSSLHEDCVQVVFSEHDYLPWDNPDNIVSAEVAAIVYRIKNNLFALLFLIGGPANVINMLIFYKQGLQDRVNLCLFALSLSDALFLTVSVVMYGEQLHEQFITKEMFGPIVKFFANNNLILLTASLAISPVLSTIIATERCLCVVSPLRFQTFLRTRTMAAVIVVISVVVTCLYSIVVFRYRIGCVYDPESGVVITTAIEGTFYRAHKGLIDAFHSYIFGVGLPGIEMIVVTITTIITIVKLRQAVTWRSGTASVISAKEVALTKTLVANSIFFLACISPVALIRFSWLFLPEVNSGRRHQNLFLVCTWFNVVLNAINATFNFFVFYVMGSRFRQSFWSLFSRKEKAGKP